MAMTRFLRGDRGDNADDPSRGFPGGGSAYFGMPDHADDLSGDDWGHMRGVATGGDGGLGDL